MHTGRRAHLIRHSLLNKESVRIGPDFADAYYRLTMMGLMEMVVETLDDYISIAIRLGKDSAWRNQISEKIAANKHCIYRDITCIKALEDFLDLAVRKRFGISV